MEKILKYFINGKTVLGTIRTSSLILCGYVLLGYNVNSSNIQNFSEIIINSKNFLYFLLIVVGINFIVYSIIPLILRLYYHKKVKVNLQKLLPQTETELKLIRKQGGIILGNLLLKYPIELGYIDSRDFKEEMDGTITIADKLVLQNDILRGTMSPICTIFLLVLTITIIFRPCFMYTFRFLSSFTLVLDSGTILSSLSVCFQKSLLKPINMLEKEFNSNLLRASVNNH